MIPSPKVGFIGRLAIQVFEFFRRWEPRALWRNLRFQHSGISDGLPLPPSERIIAVAGSPDQALFLSTGQAMFEQLKEVLGRVPCEPGRSLEILDFACGCGRVTRHWKSEPNVRVRGVDTNPALIDWCTRNLTFAEFMVNTPEPPLPYADGQFAFVYALSVFTHLDEKDQGPWMQELCRVLRAGGKLFFTTHGESLIKGRLTAADRIRFQAGKLVVRRAWAAGTNLCNAYHPPAYVREVLIGRDLEIVEHIPSGALGTSSQDIYVISRKGASNR